MTTTRTRTPNTNRKPYTPQPYSPCHYESPSRVEKTIAITSLLVAVAALIGTAYVLWGV